jgi:uncharacterized membrane protein
VDHYLTRRYRGTALQVLRAAVTVCLCKTQFMQNTLTKTLLTCGIFVAPVFYIVAVFQIFTRFGFDIRRHPISYLSLGDLGWIQITNFLVTGLLAILGAVGIRRFLRHSRGGTWGPLLIGLYGVGMIIGGMFTPDPGFGFPPGAPAGAPTTMSGHAGIHMLGFFIAFLSLIATCFVFMWRSPSRKERRWAIYCAASGLMAPALIILGTTSKDWVGVIIAFAGLVAFGWLSVLSARLLTELRRIPGQ